MIRLRQTFGAHAGRSLDFDTDVITVGRLPESDIAFDPRADIDASGRHAEIRREQGIWYVVDAGSRNGTWLRGERVARAPLRVGDEVEFGRGGPRLHVEVAGAGPAPNALPADVGLLPTAQWPATDAPAIRGSGAPPARAASPSEAPPGFRAFESQPPPSAFRASGSPVPPSFGGAASQPPPSFRSPASQPPPSFRSPASQPPPSFRAPASPVPPAGFHAPPSGRMADGGASAPSRAPRGARGESAPIHALPQGAHGGSAARGSGGAPSGGSAPTSPGRGTGPRHGAGPGLRVAVAFGLLALVFAGLAVGLLVWRLRETATSRHADRSRLPAATAAAVLAAQVGPAVHVVTARRADGATVPLCTAFAVRIDIAATSGRCVTLAEQERARGARVVLTQPGRADDADIVTMYRHPQFDAAVAGASNDVGVIRTAATLTALMPLPTLADLRTLTPGEPAYVVTRAAAAGGAAGPVVLAGALGTPEHFDGTPSPFEGAQLLPHSARVPRGGAGAPVLDGTGLLVGVHASEDLATPSLSVRADVLLALLAGLGA